MKIRYETLHRKIKRLGEDPEALRSLMSDYNKGGVDVGETSNMGLDDLRLFMLDNYSNDELRGLLDLKRNK